MVLGPWLTSFWITPTWCLTSKAFRIFGLFNADWARGNLSYSWRFSCAAWASCLLEDLKTVRCPEHLRTGRHPQKVRASPNHSTCMDFEADRERLTRTYIPARRGERYLSS